MAKSNSSAAFINRTNCPMAFITIWLAGKRLRHGAVVITVKSTVHGLGVYVGSGFWIPLCHQFAGWTCVGTVFPCCAGLVGRHGPAAVFAAWVDDYHAAGVWECAGCPLLEGGVLISRLDCEWCGRRLEPYETHARAHNWRSMGARMVMNIFGAWFQGAALEDFGDQGFMGGGVGVEGGDCG